MEIAESNKILAEFMGYKPAVVLDGNPQYPPYNKEWYFLMPVVEKICRTPFEDGEFAYIRTFGMQSEDGKLMVRFNRFAVHEAAMLIDATYEAVVEFIQFNNQQAT